MVQSIEDSSLENISNQINWSRSQISILYIKFPVFFPLESNVWKPLKVSIKVQRIVGTLSRMRSGMSVTYQRIFSGENNLSGDEENSGPLKKMYFHVFFEKDHLSFSF